MPLVEIHRSTRAACEHRAFVLNAVGIGSEIVPLEDRYALFVDGDSARLACEQLDLYYAENANPTRKRRPPRVQSFAWIAPAIFALILIGVAFLAGRNTFGHDWYAAGALMQSLRTKGEGWRAITALTLHADHQHLLSNLGFGALFSFVLSRLIGWGIALAGILVAAVLGNVVDIFLAPPSHVSIGASTLVFATLGLVAAYSWKIQVDGRLRWAHRWAPLIVGVMLLGFLGANGENTDVLAHLTGFFFGAFCGAMLTVIPPQIFANAVVQSLCGCFAVVSLAGAWIVALNDTVH